MTPLGRRILALEDVSGSPTDRLADAVVLVLYKRSGDADPASVEEAERWLEARRRSHDFPADMPIEIFFGAIRRVLTFHEKERTLAHLVGLQKADRSHPKGDGNNLR